MSNNKGKGLLSDSRVVGALSAKIEINNCSIRNIFQDVKLKITTDFFMVLCQNKKSLQNCQGSGARNLPILFTVE